MRLWHEALIPYLPRQQLLGLHREVCALRGNGWGKKHATVDYVFTHPYGWLFAYHMKVVAEMRNRGYNPDKNWNCFNYRGDGVERNCDTQIFMDFLTRVNQCRAYRCEIYPEHNAAYLQECLENLEGKGIHIDMEKKGGG